VVIVERDGGDDARPARIADIDDRGAEMMRIGNVPDIGMRAADRDLPRPGEIEMPQAADVAGEHLAFHCIHRVRTFPSRIWGTTDEAVANIICTWPAITSCNAGAAPL